MTLPGQNVMLRRWMPYGLLACVCVVGELRAQSDGLVAFPETYRVQFENPWVRVVRIHVAGGANIGMHTHPPGFMFHVYLNDAEPISFNHDGAPYEIQRPPVTARSYRIGLATPESHAVVNPSAKASDYMRVEYKTRGGESTRRRMPAPALGSETASQIEHVGPQSRVTRVTVAANSSIELATPGGQPALLIFVTDGADGTGQLIKVGDHRFLDPSGKTTIRNAGASPLQLLRFDFLTPPA